MSDERFTIRWSDGRYTVSIPRYDGGEVVTADHHDAEVAALRAEVERLREAVEIARAELKDTFSGTLVNPDELPDGAVNTLVRAVHRGADRALKDIFAALAAQPEGDSDE